MLKKKIIQIIPAIGWFAVYRDGNEFDSEMIESPLACWALVQDEDGFTHVTGMDADDSSLYMSDEVGNLERYRYRPESTHG